MTDIQTTGQKKGIPFATLQKGIRDWLQSDIVTDVIVLLNERYGAFAGEVRVLPRLITRVAVGMTPPELFTKELGHYLPFMKDEDTYKLAFDVKSRIFKPIRAALKSGYDIDTDKISTTPPPTKMAARTMKIEAPIPPAPVATSPQPTTAVAPRPPAVPTQKARIMEIQHVVDLRRPPATQTAAAAGKPASQPVQTTAAARVTKLSQGISTKQNVAERPVNPKPIAAAPKNPDGNSKVSEAPKPFGLAESIPKAPAIAPQVPVTPAPTTPERHELTEYYDEHPEVITNKETK